MLETRKTNGPMGKGWHTLVLPELTDVLLSKPWSKELFLRGSFARSSEDTESDIDLVVTVADGEFASAIDALFNLHPPTQRSWLPPWFDGLVRDFGGLGLVYLFQAEEEKWGQVDIYLLPESRKRQLIDCDSVLALNPGGAWEDVGRPTENSVDDTRGQFTRFAAHNPEQAVLACYVTAFLLRKRLVRRDPFQIYAETHALAACVRDLIVLVCHPNRWEQGWRELQKVADRSSAPDTIMKALATFIRCDVLEQPSELADRVARLEEIVALLTPALWKEHGEAFRSLGRYLCSPGRARATGP